MSERLHAARPARRRVAAVLAAVVVGVTGLIGVPSGVDAQSSSDFPSVGNNFDRSGPYRTTTSNERDHRIYYPRDIASTGLEHPVILWGNGTAAPTGTYGSLLNHFASHGFIVVAADTTFAGNGRDMLAGIDLIAGLNRNSRSDFYQAVDLSNIGATGHSQGGGGAMEAGKDRRVGTIFPLQPWNGNARGISGSAFYMAGQRDLIVSSRSVRRYYTSSSGIPAAFGDRAGATHTSVTGNGGNFRGAATAWARWQLMGDPIAQDLFVGSNCGLCSDRNWDYESNRRLVATVSGGGSGGGGGSDCRPIDRLLGRC